MRPISKNPVPVGEILEHEFRIPYGLTQQQFADALGISRVRYAEIAKGRRGITTDTALRLARVLGTTPDLWLNLQRDVDIRAAERSEEYAAIRKLPMLKAAR